MVELRNRRANERAGARSDSGPCSGSNKLNEGEIDIWQVDLRKMHWDRFASVLSQDEREKTNRFRYPRLRENFSRMRTATRLILGRYLGKSADRIKFSYTQAGKPRITESRLYFNVSHSNDFGLVAVALDPVGVDIELMTALNLERTEIVPMVCHESERAELNRSSAAERCHLFHQLWTRKEAFCKAIAVGLQYGIADLFFRRQCAPSLYQVYDRRRGQLPYYVHDLACPFGYVGSICAPFRPATVRMLDASFSGGLEDGQ